MTRVLILLAHPRLPASRINAALLRAARGVAGVSVHDLYAAYPDGVIDVAAEQARLLDHDVVVVQGPIYWYSMPPLAKAWLDEVLLSGWAYGQDGDALVGKSLLLALTSGGDPADYGRHTGQFTLAELFRPWEATARYCGMHWRGLVAYGAEQDLNAQLPTMAAHYERHLRALVAGELPAVVDTR